MDPWSICLIGDIFISSSTRCSHVGNSLLATLRASCSVFGIDGRSTQITCRGNFGVSLQPSVLCPLPEENVVVSSQALSRATIYLRALFSNRDTATTLNRHSVKTPAQHRAYQTLCVSKPPTSRSRVKTKCFVLPQCPTNTAQCPDHIP